MANKMNSKTASTSKPLVALLDGRDCSVEMIVLKDIATVAFCDAGSVSEVHERVLQEAEAVLMWHRISLNRDDLSKFKNLKVIVKIGSGYDNIDIKSAGEFGIAVCNIPGYDIEETADSTICFILNLYRQTYWLANMVKDGKKISGPEVLQDISMGCLRIRGETLGIIGLGRVGTAVALRAKVFGFRVIFYDPYVNDGVEFSIGIERVHTLQDILSQSDCISLHCTLNNDTNKLIREETIKLMRRGAFLVNTASGGLINESDLLENLNNGHLRAAALDVMANEPFVASESLLSNCSKVIMTPHSSFFSDTSLKELKEAAANEVRRAITGRHPLENIRNCVNKEYFFQYNGAKKGTDVLKGPQQPVVSESNTNFGNYPQMGSMQIPNFMGFPAGYSLLNPNMNFNLRSPSGQPLSNVEIEMQLANALGNANSKAGWPVMFTKSNQ